MKKLDRFILKAFAGPFAAILLIVVFILIMQFLWVYIDELVGKGLSMKVIGEFLFWGACTVLPTSIPLATLLSSMMVIGQMSENNEMMALKAAGVSTWRVFRPVMVCAFFISVVTFFVGNNLVPKAYNEIYTLRDDIGKTKEEIKIPVKTFYSGIDGYILRVESRDDKSGMMYDVMVYDHSGKKGNNSLTLADSAEIRISGQKDYLTFAMFNGVNYQEDSKRDYIDTTMELSRTEFLRQELIISLENYTFQKSDSAKFADQVKSMSIAQLRDYRDTLSKDNEALKQTHRTKFVNFDYLRYSRQLIDSAILASDLDLYEAENYLVMDDDDVRKRVYSSASNKLGQMAEEVKMFERERYQYEFYLRRTKTELMGKFATALACFILFFIGAPLGALIRKGGLGVSAIVSALFFVLYWVVNIIGVKLAKDGAISPFAGAYISSFVLGPVGAYLTYASVKEVPLFGGDRFRSRWRELKHKIMEKVKPVRIVYMGTPEFAVAPLDALVSKGYKVVGVVTVADKPSGRGLKVNESAVKKYAVEHDIPVLQPVKLKDPEFLESLAAWKADLFVVVAFRVLPEEVWSMPRLGTFNLHAALLPQYRGAAPINWAVINGEKMTGVTTFMIDKDIDTGGIILRQDCKIGPEETAGDVHDRLMEIGTDLVVQTVDGIVDGKVETRVQRSFVQGSEILKPAPKIHRELCHIDWSDTSRNIFNLVRGLSPYPAAFTELVREGEQPLQLKIFSAEVADMNIPAGAVASDGKTYLAIGTADGALSLREVQLSGKKRMSVEDFLKGFREPESYATTQGTSKREIEATRV